MQHTCNTHATHMQHTCNTHATHMQHTCNTHATHMQHTCNTHATHMQHTCNTHATHMQQATKAFLFIGRVSLRFSCIGCLQHAGTSTTTSPFSWCSTTFCWVSSTFFYACWWWLRLTPWCSWDSTGLLCQEVGRSMTLVRHIWLDTVVLIPQPNNQAQRVLTNCWVSLCLH